MKNGIYRFLLSACLILSACSKPKDVSCQNKPQIFRACLIPFSLHPAYGFDTGSQLLIRALFEGLTRVDSDGQTQPALAETIQISEDKKIYTFVLKECNWSNGDPVLATDFAYAWKKIISYDSDATLCDLFYLIKNAKAIKEKKLPIDEVGIEVLDSHTLRVELEHPASYFLHLLANPIFSPVCQRVDVADAQWHLQAGSSFVCNGPFRLLRKDEGNLIMEKNPLYHDRENVALSEVHIHYVNDPYTTLLMFEKGEIDWIGDPFEKIPLEAVPALIARNMLTIHPIAGVYFLMCNTGSYPLNSANIRKALAYGINRYELTSNVLIGHKAAFSIAPDMLTYLDEIDKMQDQDIEKARMYFEAGLAELGVTEEEFPSLELSYTFFQKPLVQSIQEQWRKNLGVKVKLHCFEWNTLFQNFGTKQFQIGPVAWNSFIEDPIFHMHAFQDQANSSNLTSWENHSFKKLINLSDQEIDETLRKQYLVQAEKIILDEMPVIPLYYQIFKFVKKDEIHHAPITDLGEFDLKWVSLSP